MSDDARSLPSPWARRHPITDSQVHVWQASTPERPWPSGRYVPSWASRPLSADVLVREMDTAGVDRAVLVPPSFEGDRNDLALAAAARFPGRFAVMGRVAVDDPRNVELVRTWRQHEGAAGFRLTLYLPEQRSWLSDGTADWLWESAEASGVPLMMHPDPDDLPLVGSVARRHPALRIIIDHLGVGREEWRRDAQAFGHLRDLLALADLPNVAVKASGLPEYSTDPFPYRNIHGYLREIVGRYGAHRVMWGTDVSRLPCTYADAIAMFTDHMDWLSADDLSWILHGSVSEWLSWDDESLTARAGSRSLDGGRR